MGCINSKYVRSKPKLPAVEYSMSFGDKNGSGVLESSQFHNLHSGFGPLEKIKEELEKEENHEAVLTHVKRKICTIWKSCIS